MNVQDMYDMYVSQFWICMQKRHANLPLEIA